MSVTMQKKAMQEDTKPAVISRRDGSFDVGVASIYGRVCADDLSVVNHVVQEFGLPGIRLSAARTMVVEGVPNDLAGRVQQALGSACASVQYMISGCPGNDVCKRGALSTASMAQRLEKVLEDIGTMPAPVKCGLSGCPRCCGESVVRDVGLMGTGKGWTVFFGGNAGRKIRAGDEVGRGLNDEQTIALVSRLLAVYRAKARPCERTARFVERVGIAMIKRVVMRGSEHGD